ncbi:MAG: carbohydrate ABC transporter permease [Acidimicrobiaceae bacterium]|nr:carbohydrate ABC transporter permease [Acidimicrobiaceae bacterium]MYH77247.1 carbohydrate ABC transporter permease [Acidimicrobiaceae bacterium]MYK76518.1 carbohydrate ABC transporter permease [Acidimicrobiaceae bacterium]
MSTSTASLAADRAERADSTVPEHGTGRRVRTLRRRAGMVLIAVFVALYLVPVAGVLATSLKTNAEIAERGIWALTGRLTLANYVDVWSTANTVRYLINSFQVAIPAVVVSIAGGTLIGYALAKFRPRGGTAIQLVIVSGLFVPPQVLLVPLFTMFRSFDLLNTLWPMILIHSAVGFSVCTLVMRNFFEQIPDSLRYAALIDGASEGEVFWRVMLPLARPALAALATLQFTFIWNDFLYPLVFTSARDDVATIMLGLLNVKGQFTVAYGTQASLAVIASIPTVAIFFVFQKHFVRGLLSGALKE